MRSKTMKFAIDNGLSGNRSQMEGNGLMKEYMRDTLCSPGVKNTRYGPV